MLALSVNDGNTAALAAMPERMRQALSDKANAIAAALLDKIQQKLAGGVLNTKSGALAHSLVATIDDASANVTVRIAASGIKYAAIQEYGGTTPPHQIVPDKARALAFAIGGKQVFAARVNLPAVTLPERSYMRSSLAEIADEIRDELSDAVAEAMQ
jgi:phage gpG-like protein